VLDLTQYANRLPGQNPNAPRPGQETGGLKKRLIRNNYQVALCMLHVKLLHGLMSLVELATYLPINRHISLLLDRLQIAIEEAHHG
jgi:hypothetical protein